jgi:hypothetical protein
MHQDIWYHTTSSYKFGVVWGWYCCMIKWVEGVGDVNVHFEAVAWPGAFTQCECNLGEPLDLVVWSPRSSLQT